jgi:hypothetical protein
MIIIIEPQILGIQTPYLVLLIALVTPPIMKLKGMSLIVVPRNGCSF